MISIFITISHFNFNNCFRSQQTKELKQVAPISSVNVQRQPIEPLGRRFLPHQGLYPD